MRHITIVLALIMSIFLAACGTSSATPTTNQIAQTNGTCDTPDARMNIDGTEVICMRNSAGNLAWTEQPQQHDDGDSQVARIDGPCQTADTRMNINGTEVICMLNSAGSLAWQSAQAPNSQSNNNQQQDHGNQIVQVGMACDSPGSTVFMNALYVCKNGSWGYPVPGDLPLTSDGSKPNWYPSLDALSSQPEATCPNSDITFTHSFLPVDQLDASIPNGAMIYDHVTPIDHAYIGIKTLRKAADTRTEADYLPIVAPADGVIMNAGSLGSPTSHRVVISHGCGVYTVYMVVNRLSGVLAAVADQVQSQGNLQLDISIKAGEEFGQQRDNPLDFNVWASESWLRGFANPLSYIYMESWKPYTADPSAFFTPEIAAQYTNVMQRTSEPRWGKIDHDVIGSASGNWFLQGTLGYSGHSIAEYATATAPIRGGQVAGKNTYAYGHLSIAPHEVDTSKWVFSTGWWQDPAGDPRQLFLVIGDGQKNPDQLTSADGVVVYGLADGGRVDVNGQPIALDAGSMAPMPVGYMLELGQARASVALQVNADGSLSLEIFPDQSNVQVTQLSENKRTYQR